MMEKILPEEWQTPTVYLVLINVIMYFITSIIGGNFILTGKTALIIFGLSIFSFTHGFIWTPLTSIFTHSSIAHIGSNMLFLLIFGFRLEERKYSPKGIYYAYLITGIVSGVVSLILFYSSNTVTAGASGAVFGLLGLNAGIERKEGNPNYKRILGVSFILFVMSGTSPNTNIFAHLFGLIIGYYLGKSDWYTQFNTELDRMK